MASNGKPEPAENLYPYIIIPDDIVLSEKIKLQSKLTKRHIEVGNRFGFRRNNPEPDPSVLRHGIHVDEGMDSGTGRTSTSRQTLCERKKEI
jgi:hypothetical protein